MGDGEEVCSVSILYGTPERRPNKVKPIENIEEMIHNLRIQLRNNPQEPQSLESAVVST
jgi:hypothetical protein